MPKTKPEPKVVRHTPKHVEKKVDRFDRLVELLAKHGIHFTDEELGEE
jgi:hypothetical protein